MAEEFIDRFGSVSSGYASFRPAYPPELFDWLALVSPGHVLAWDSGTGTGQAAGALARHFKHVLATDASAAQIAQATPVAGVEYRVASAENSGLASRSVDLVSVAQALHWFNLDQFFAETARVLKPGGVLAVWTYGLLRAEDSGIDAIIRHFHGTTVGAYWPAERTLVDSGYRTIVLPFPEIATPAFTMSTRHTLVGLLGFLQTWSATARYKEAMGQDPVDHVRMDLVATWGDPDRELGFTWPLTVRAGRKSAE